jgi:hypothetical protein
MEFDNREFRRKFPHLYKELGEPEEEDSIRPIDQDKNPLLAGDCTSEVISYLRRARTDDEALEVISYLKGRGEILEEQASDLRRQIEERGVRSFGDLKTWGHYEREFRKKTKKETNEEEQEDQPVD